MNVAVIFHCFYFDLIDEFLGYFKKITVPFKLFMTVPKDVYPSEEVENLTRMVLEIYPDAVIISCKNYGADIYPCFCVMDYILLNNMHFDKYVKVHTKKSLWKSDKSVGESWRKDLCSVVFNNFKTNLKFSGIVSCKEHPAYFLQSKRDVHLQNFYTKVFSHFDYSLPEKGTMYSVGTMFIIDGDIWEDFFHRNYLKPYDLSNLSNHMILESFERIWELLPLFYKKPLNLL